MTDDALMAMLDVQPAALFTFSTNLVEKASEATQQVNEKMSALGSAKFGFAPVSSGGPLARGYVHSIQQTTGFMADVGKGTGAFMAAAQTIAVNYIVSDDASKDQMSDVQSAFDVANVPEGQQTYSEMYTADAEQTEERVGAIDPVELPPANDPTPNDYTSPADSPAEQADAAAAEFREFDQNTNNNNGLEDAYPSIDAPLDVQIAHNNATSDDAVLHVVDADGRATKIPNPIYVPPPHYTQMQTSPTYEY